MGDLAHRKDMTHWKESAEILSRLGSLAAAGRRAALATVVRISGSAYRRPGAKLLVEDEGHTLGSVSGGCLEADVREIAQAVLLSGEPRLRHYDTGSHEDMVWGLGLGCNGEIDVFVQPATEGPLAALAHPLSTLLAGDSPFAVATVVEGGRQAGEALVVGTGETHGSLGSAELDHLAVEWALRPGRAGLSDLYPLGDRLVFFEHLAPPLHLAIFGAGDDAMPLAAYAADAGFRVTVLDHRPALLSPARFPQATRLVEGRPDGTLELSNPARTLAVIKTHSLAHDREWARRLLAAGVPYVGLLGPRARTADLLRDIGAEGDERVFGPVGLDLGAEGPHQIAIAVVAELLAFSAGREPRHLSQRHEAAHAR